MVLSSQLMQRNDDIVAFLLDQYLPELAQHLNQIKIRTNNPELWSNLYPRSNTNVQNIINSKNLRSDSVVSNVTRVKDKLIHHANWKICLLCDCMRAFEIELRKNHYNISLDQFFIILKNIYTHSVKHNNRHISAKQLKILLKKFI